MQTLLGHVRTFLVGFIIGLANLIPGVSGGTMALLLGVYEALLDALRALSDPAWVRALARGRWRAAFEALPWAFLMSLGSGALLAIFSLSHALEWLYHHYPVPLEAFFFGLVAASIVLVARRVRRWGLSQGVALGIGFVVTWLVLGLSPLHTPRSLPLLLLSAFLASAAMVLPGLSGAYVLMVMGQYRYALAAVTGRDVVTLVLLAGSAAVGILSIARVLDGLFKRYHDWTLAALTGLVLASLRRLWPWKVVSAADEALAQNVLPAAWTWEVTLALGLAVAGAALVLVLSRVAKHEG